jgi:hypothetical protein
MFRKLIPYLTIVLIIASCSKKPKNLISKNKMADILIDARFINGATGVNRKTMEDYGADLDSYIYEKYGIDSLQFATSSNYYSENVKDYEEIFGKVIDSLEKLKTALKTLEEKETKEKEKREKDSIASLEIKDTLNLSSSVKDSLLKARPREKIKKEIKKEEGVLITPISSKD